MIADRYYQPKDLRMLSKSFRALIEIAHFISALMWNFHSWIYGKEITGEPFCIVDMIIAKSLRIFSCQTREHSCHFWRRLKSFYDCHFPAKLSENSQQKENHFNMSAWATKRFSSKKGHRLDEVEMISQHFFIRKYALEYMFGLWVGIRIQYQVEPKCENCVVSLNKLESDSIWIDEVKHCFQVNQITVRRVVSSWTIT